MGRGIRRDHEKNSTPYEEPIQEQEDVLRPGEQLFSCIECAHSFTIKVAEALWYEQKGFPLPKRCARCRAERKRVMNTPHSPVVNRCE